MNSSSVSQCDTSATDSSIQRLNHATTGRGVITSSIKYFVYIYIYMCVCVCVCVCVYVRVYIYHWRKKRGGGAWGA